MAVGDQTILAVCVPRASHACSRLWWAWTERWKEPVYFECRQEESQVEREKSELSRRAWPLERNRYLGEKRESASQKMGLRGRVRRGKMSGEEC